MDFKFPQNRRNFEVQDEEISQVIEFAEGHILLTVQPSTDVKILREWELTFVIKDPNE